MQNEYELEQELEQELEGESEFEAEGETEFEGESEFEGEGELESELEGESEFEGEGELELELEGESESEFEGEGESEQFLGGLARSAGSMLGLSEAELEQELLGELGELEGEQFFKKLRGLGRAVKGFAKRAAPMLKRVGRFAAPFVGKALGGMIGGPAGAMLGARLAKLAASQLREGEFEFEHEFEHEYEHEQELEFEHEQEFEHELESHEQMGELMAHFAAQAESEGEAEAMIGAATMISLSPRDRRALRGLVPLLVRGASILTRALRMRRSTRPAVRLVPTIMRRTAKTLSRAAASGRPVSPRTAAKVAARTVRSVLSKPSTCNRALRRSITAARRAAGRR